MIVSILNIQEMRFDWYYKVLFYVVNCSKVGISKVLLSKKESTRIIPEYKQFISIKFTVKKRERENLFH